MPGPEIRLSQFEDSRQIMLTRFLDHGRSIQDAARIEAGGRRGLPRLATTPRRDDHVVVWQLYANATRESGRSPRGYRTERKALKHARALLQGLDRVGTHDLSLPGGRFGWFLTLDGTPALVSTRWFDSPSDSEHSLDDALIALRDAVIASRVRMLRVRRSGPLDLPRPSISARFGLAS